MVKSVILKITLYFGYIKLVLQVKHSPDFGPKFCNVLKLTWKYNITFQIKGAEDLKSYLENCRVEVVLHNHPWCYEKIKIFGQKVFVWFLDILKVLKSEKVILILENFLAYHCVHGNIRHFQMSDYVQQVNFGEKWWYSNAMISLKSHARDYR